MTWIGNDATSFNGLQQYRAKPRAYIFEEDIEGTISDLALTCQFTRNQDFWRTRGRALAGTYPLGQIYLTEDYGDSWSLVQRLGAETCIYSLAALGNDVVLAGTYPNGHIYRSTDNGDTWGDEGQLGTSQSIWSLVNCTGGVACAGAGATGKIWRTTDWGDNWSDEGRLGAETYVYSLCYCGNDRVLAGTTGGNVYSSDDGGDSWALEQRLGSESRVYSFAYLGGGRVLAGTYPTGQVYESDDDGDTWALVQRLGAETYVWSLAYCGRDVVVAGCGAGTGNVYRSLDGGSTWALYGQLGAETHAYSIRHLGNGIVSAGTAAGGKIYRSTDYADSFSLEQQLGTEQYVVYQENLDLFDPDDDLVWTGGSGSGMPGYQNHSGDGRGCALGWPLSSINFGKGVTAGGAYHGGVKYPTIDASQSAGSTDYKHLYRWPCYIPTGIDKVVVHVRASSNLAEVSPAVVRYTTTFASGAEMGTLTIEGTPVRYYDHRDGSEKSYFFEVPISAAGDLYVFGIDIDIGTSDDKVSFYSARILPVVWEAVAAAPDDEWGVGTRNTNYQAPTATAFPRISDVHTATGRSLNAYTLSKAAEAHSYTFELLTDASLDGETPSTTGHDHDGLDSETIELSLQSTCLGWHTPGTASAEGITTTEGDAGRAPMLGINGTGSGNNDDLAITALYVPRYALDTTRTVYWAAVCFNDATDLHLRCELSDAITDSPFDTLGDFAEGASGSAAWVVYKEDIAATDGALSWAKIIGHGGKASAGTMTGFCFWVE